MWTGSSLEEGGGHQHNTRNSQEKRVTNTAPQSSSGIVFFLLFTLDRCQLSRRSVMLLHQPFLFLQAVIVNVPVISVSSFWKKIKLINSERSWDNSFLDNILKQKFTKNPMKNIILKNKNI